MISESDFKKLRPDDSIKIGETTYIIDDVDVIRGKYVILNMYFKCRGRKTYAYGGPFTYTTMKCLITEIKKKKISCWKDRILGGTK